LDGESACRKAATYTGQHKHRINADRHPCLEWDLNLRSQCLSGRTQSLLSTTKYSLRLSKERSCSFAIQVLSNCQQGMYNLRLVGHVQSVNCIHFAQNIIRYNAMRIHARVICREKKSDVVRLRSFQIVMGGNDKKSSK
jgi:hypothetical protein